MEVVGRAENYIFIPAVLGSARWICSMDLLERSVRGGELKMFSARCAHYKIGICSANLTDESA